MPSNSHYLSHSPMSRTASIDSCLAFRKSRTQVGNMVTESKRPTVFKRYGAANMSEKGLNIDFTKYDQLESCPLLGDLWYMLRNRTARPFFRRPTWLARPLLPLTPRSYAAPLRQRCGYPWRCRVPVTTRTRSCAAF